jgi:chromosome partitioning protein
MSKTISICNQKGGVGKTTTAVNLATYLALFGKKVLLIDIDPQSNATSGLGIDKHSLKTSIYDILINETDPQQIVMATGIDNFSIIPSNLNLTGAEVELVGLMGREYRLKKALTKISQNYDFIFMDCPPSLGLLTINALAASDSILIPIQCEYYALEGLSQLVNTINLVKENINSSLTIEGVLLTMADFRTNLTNEVIKEARNFFREKVYDVVIPRNIRITESPGFGKPVALYDSSSIGAQKYKEFAEEMLGIKKVNIEQQAQSNEPNLNNFNELEKVGESEAK